MRGFFNRGRSCIDGQPVGRSPRTRHGTTAALLAASIVATAGQAADPQRDAAITAPIRAMEQAWNAGDGTAWGNTFWPDADSVNIYGATLHGGPAMGARHGVVFAGRLKGTQMHSTIVGIRRVGADAGVIETIQAVEPPAGPTKLNSIKVFVTVVVERRHGIWKAAHVQNTTIAPPPAE